MWSHGDTFNVVQQGEVMRRVSLGTERGDVGEGVRRRCNNYDGFLSKWFSKGLPVPFTCSEF